MTWWRSLHPTYKALSALAVVLFVGALLGGWLGLPGQVESNTERIRSLEQTVQRMDARWERVLCHLEEQRREEPAWERCQ